MKCVGCLWLFLLLSGCQVAGLVAYQAAAHATIDPEYTPPKTPILIVAENYGNPSLCTYEAEQLAQEIGVLFKEHNVAPVVSGDKLRQVRDEAGAAARKMSLQELGEKTGASQVLYLNITDCQWESLAGTRMAKGQINVLVKLVDVASGETKWPDVVSDGKPMSVSSPYAEQKGTGDGLMMQQQLCRQLAKNIALLFYPHKAYEADEQQ